LKNALAGDKLDRLIDLCHAKILTLYPEQASFLFTRVPCRGWSVEAGFSVWPAILCAYATDVRRRKIVDSESSVDIAEM
jgi:hypothetical protein